MQNSFDSIVIGAGLSGLTAALHLQKAGHKVLIVEKRNVPGGLCGTTHFDGYEFVIAANDFGRILERQIKSLDIPLKFKKAKTKFFINGTTLTSPPDPKTLLKLATCAGDLIRFIKAFKTHETLEDAVKATVKDKTLSEFLLALAYPLGMLPKEVQLTSLKKTFSKEFNYGYDQPTLPVGGPRALVDAMVDAFVHRGGQLILGTDCTALGKEIVTEKGKFKGDFVVSSTGRWDQYSNDFKPGLAISMFHLAVKKELIFPKGIHTLVHLPEGVEQWMNDIDSGRQPGAFGFHLFPSELGEKGLYYTINVYFYLPREINDLSHSAENYIFTNAEKMLPGLGEAMIYKKFISAADFQKIHGLSSQATRFVVSGKFDKPSIYDADKDIYYVGNSVYPDGEHAGGAMLSGQLAAQHILLGGKKGEKRR